MSLPFGSKPSLSFDGFRPLDQVSGTGHVEYEPVVGCEVIMIFGTVQSTQVKHHCITCMKEYEGKSFEELRLEDYKCGRSTESICEKQLIYRRPSVLVTWGKDGPREEFNPGHKQAHTSTELHLNCRKIRIGSYQYAPKHRVYVTGKGIKIVAPSPNKDSQDVSLHIQRNEILRIFLYFGQYLPSIFLYTNIECGEYIRKSLNMAEDSEFYYNPMSNKEPYKRITLILKTEFPKSTLISLYGNIIEEISASEALDIYAGVCSEDKDKSESRKLFYGTAKGYQPVFGTDVITKSGCQVNIGVYHHCITVMKIYEHKSLEELRLEDYDSGRSKCSKKNSTFGFPDQNKPVILGTGMSSSFGTPTFTSSAGFGFKPSGYTPFLEAPTHDFGFGSSQNNTGLNKPTGIRIFDTPATTHSVFGTNKSSFGFGCNSQIQNSNKKTTESLFSAPIDIATSGTTTSLFGAKPLLGFSPASTQSGDSSTSSSLFGAKPLFGVPTATTQSSNPGSTIFGSKPINSSPASTQFGNSNTSSSLFGAKSLFGVPTSTTQSSNPGSTTFGAKPISSFPVSTQSGNSSTNSSFFGAKPFGFSPAKTESGNVGYTPSFLPTKPPFSPFLITKPETSIFASAPVSKSDTTSIFASVPDTKSEMTSIFASPPVTKSGSTTIFALPQVSNSGTTSIFTSAPVSKSETTSIFASAPITKPNTSIFTSPPVRQPGPTSIFTSPPVRQPGPTSIFASPPVGNSETTTISASLTVSTGSDSSGNSTLSNTSPKRTSDPTSDAPAVKQSDLNKSFNNISLEGKSEENTISEEKPSENEPTNILLTDLIVHNPLS